MATPVTDEKMDDRYSTIQLSHRAGVICWMDGSSTVGGCGHWSVKKFKDECVDPPPLPPFPRTPPSFTTHSHTHHHSLTHTHSMHHPALMVENTPYKRNIHSLSGAFTLCRTLGQFLHHCGPSVTGALSSAGLRHNPSPPTTTTHHQRSSTTTTTIRGNYRSLCPLASPSLLFLTLFSADIFLLWEGHFVESKDDDKEERANNVKKALMSLGTATRASVAFPPHKHLQHSSRGFPMMKNSDESCPTASLRSWLPVYPARWSWTLMSQLLMRKQLISDAMFLQSLNTLKTRTELK